MCKAIYDMVEDGRQEGRLEGKAEGKAEDVDRICQTFDVTLEAACDVVGISVEQYNQAKERMTEIYV